MSSPLTCGTCPLGAQRGGGPRGAGAVAARGRADRGGPGRVGARLPAASAPSGDCRLGGRTSAYGRHVGRAGTDGGSARGSAIRRRTCVVRSPGRVKCLHVVAPWIGGGRVERCAGRQV